MTIQEMKSQSLGQHYLLGFDIGGTKCAVILGKVLTGTAPPQDVHIIDRISFSTPKTFPPEHTLGLLEMKARELVQKHNLEEHELKAIGISCGGPLSSRRGVILSPPNLPGWDNVAIVERFQRAFGVPAYLQNDANACALAEWQWGAGQGCETLIFLTFGTGMGAGLIISGRLHAGQDDLAGEVGHWRMSEDGPVGFGKAGSFEGFCSGGGVARFTQKLIRKRWEQGHMVSWCQDEAQLQVIDTRAVAQAAFAQDSLALEIFETCGFYLGRGISQMIDLLNPEVIVIGSIFARCEELLRPSMGRVLYEETLSAALARCRIVPAQLGEQVGDYAALAVASAGVQSRSEEMLGR